MRPTGEHYENLKTRVSPRLARRIEADFGAKRIHVMERLEAIQMHVSSETERVLTTVVLSANGNWDELNRAAALAEQDWRDVLMGTRLENWDWEARLDAVLGLSPDARPETQEQQPDVASTGEAEQS